MKAKDNKKYALIVNGAVAQIFTKEDIAEWDENSILAVELTKKQESSIEVGQSYNESGFVEITLDEAKQKAINFINKNFEYECDSVKGEYVPQEEVLTWNTQEAEAKAYQTSKKSSDCPMLSALATARGIDLATLAAKVIEKSEKYRAAIIALTANRQSLQDKIEACTTIAQVDKIEYKSPLASE